MTLLPGVWIAAGAPDAVGYARKLPRVGSELISRIKGFGKCQNSWRAEG